MNGTLTINIDNKSFKVEKGITILQAAEQNDIYIPTLCAHKDLTPYGGCRMCLVEVEGARGFLTSCTTPIEDGMIIRTHTDQIQTERREILKLILSEHTSSCLICEEKNECRKAMSTIRKAGVTTGCRYCPNDNKCELQKVVEWFGIKEINYPVYYRNLRVEKEDPFYDRDYNLCILCGRCVRICQEVRNANTLAFTQRGRHTIIGPAFNRTHLEAGCEFCGACVSVCPTGALAEKSNKWDGEPEREEITTCALCGVGCQMRVLIKNNKVMGTLPAEDSPVNEGQLCVKGRFCVNELVNNYQRLKKPSKAYNGAKLEIKWEEALDLAAEKLSNCSPEDFAMLISPNCCNEDLYIAQKFTRTVMDSSNIDTTARLFYGSGFNEYLNLMQLDVPLSSVDEAALVLAIGLDMRYGRSVIGVKLRKANARGSKIVTINPQRHSLSLTADVWLQPSPGAEAEILDFLVALTTSNKKRNQDKELLKIAEMLNEASTTVIVVGSDFLQYDNSQQILQSINKLARKVGAGVLPLPPQNNLYGSLMMGTYPELLPGGLAATENNRVDKLKEMWGQNIPLFNSNWNTERILTGDRTKVAYLIGEVPLTSKPDSEFLICQNIYDTVKADLTLPAAAFTEIDGTFINCEGRIQRVRKAVEPPGEALPDWEILCRIAQKMGATGFNFSTASEIYQEIACLVDEFSDFDNIIHPLTTEVTLKIQSAKQTDMKKANKQFPFLLTTSIAEHTYRGIPLTNKVEGLKKLIAEEVLIINHEDATNAGISQGEDVIVISDQFEKIWPAWISSEQTQGTLHVIQRRLQPINPNPHYVNIRRKDS